MRPLLVLVTLVILIQTMAVTAEAQRRSPTPIAPSSGAPQVVIPKIIAFGPQIGPRETLSPDIAITPFQGAAVLEIGTMAYVIPPLVVQQVQN